MVKIHAVKVIAGAALIVVAVFSLAAFRAPASGSERVISAKPTASGVLSMAYETNTDQPASQGLLKSTGPTSQNCFSAQYHASTDCDRVPNRRLR